MCQTSGVTKGNTYIEVEINHQLHVKGIHYPRDNLAIVWCSEQFARKIKDDWVYYQTVGALLADISIEPIDASKVPTSNLSILSNDVSVGRLWSNCVSFFVIYCYD